MIGRDQIIIGLSPTCLRIGVLKGSRINAVRSVPLSPGEWDQAWGDELRPLDARLNAALGELGVGTGANARVVYFSPQATAEVFSVPVKGAAAYQAAQFSMTESLPSRGEQWPTSFAALSSDRGSASAPKTHVLGLADSARTAESLACWLARAGLNIGEFIPAKAAALAQAARVAKSLPHEGTFAILWVEDHATVLAGWSGGRLIFARSLDFGYWMLADAMMRGAKVGDQRGIEQPLAYSTLFTAGVPQRHLGLVTQDGMSLEGVLPLMQPVLQRYVVETRQTLRFSVPEAEQGRIKIILAGPGAAIPNLSTALETHFDSSIDVRPELCDGVSPQEAGELASVPGLEFSGLLAPSEAERRMNRRLNGALRVGGAVVAMLLIAAGGWAYARNAAVRRELDGLSERVQAMTDHELKIASAQKLSADITTASKMIKETIGERPRWVAALAMVSRDCGQHVELNHVAGSYPPEEGKAPVITLSGTAYPGVGSADSLTEFVSKVSRSPLVANVKIVSTHATEVAGVEAKAFIISIHLRAVDADAGLISVLDGKVGESIASAEERP